MSLPQLYAMPQTPGDWQAWAFNHAAGHYDWVRAALEQKHQQLVQYQLSPLPFENLGLWLYQHQSMHNQINTVLGTSGFDLLELDWGDPDQLQEWLNLNGDEHVRIAAALGV